MPKIALIGAGYVADLYLRSFALYPEIEIIGVYDRDAKRATAFCDHWTLSKIDSLEAGRHVYSENRCDQRCSRRRVPHSENYS